MASPQAQSFVERFNRILGERSNMPMSAPVMPQYSDRAMATAARNRNMTGSRRRTGSSSKKAQQKPKLTKEQLEKQGQEFIKNMDDDRWNPFEGSFLRSIPGRTLELLSRPGRAGFEAARNSVESINAGEPVWSLGDDIVSGAVSGLWGTAKTGAGDVGAEARKGDMANRHRSVEFLGPVTNWLNTQNAAGEMLERDIATGPLMNAARLEGFAGEVMLDPINLAGGKVAMSLSETDEIVQGAEDIVQAIAKKADDSSKAAASNAGRNLGRKFTSKASRDAGVPITQSGSKVIGDIVAEKMRQSMLELTGRSPQQGKILYGPREVSGVAAATAGQAYSDLALKKFEDALSLFKDHLAGNISLNSADFARMMKNKEFQKFWDEYISAVNAGGKGRNITTFDELVAFTNKNSLRFKPAHYVDNAAATARASIADEVVSLQDEIQEYVSKMAYNSPGLRVGSKVIPFKRVGKAYAASRAKASKRLPGIADTADELSYARQFPGRLSLVTQKVKGMGIRAYDELHAEAKKVADTLTREEQEHLMLLIERGIPSADPRIEGARIWIMDQYDKMFKEEVSMGVRKASEAKPDNYVYVFNKSGRRQARTDFKNQRRTHIRSTRDTKGYGYEDAIKAGLKPEKNAFNALLYRKMKSNRDLTRAWFKKDLLDHYGLMTKKMPKTVSDKRKLRLMNTSDLPEEMKAILDAKDGWYLPKEMAEVLDNFTKLSSLSSDELGYFLRNLDLITNKFKMLATIPYPAFHIRNMLGDIFMGWMDGVRYADYNELLKKATANRGGKPTSFIFRTAKGDKHLTYDEFIKLYQENAAAGGFYLTDISVNPMSKLAGKGREFSEAREDFGRAAHFLHALREESVRTGNWDKAVEQAVYRVNKYKFDYSALTKVEREWFRRIMPFYTYTRKAIPTLVESLFLNPKHLVQFNKLMSNTPTDPLEMTMVPQWRREIGYQMLPGEENSAEPWGVTMDWGPTAPLNFFDFGSPNEFARSVTKGVNPFLSLPFEMALEKQLYNDQNIYDWKDYFLSKVPPYSAFEGVTTDNDSWMEKFLSARLISPGLNIRKLTEGEQELALNEKRDRLVDDPFRQVNYELRDSGVSVYMSNSSQGVVFRVKDQETDQVIFESLDPDEASAAARKYAQSKK